MTRRQRGWTLIESMIAMAIFAIALGAAGGAFGVLDGPGSVGVRADRSLAAVNVLTSAHQAALLEPMVPGRTELPSADPDIRLSRTVEVDGPNLQRLIFVASWRDGPRTRERRLVSLKVTP